MARTFLQPGDGKAGKIRVLVQGQIMARGQVLRMPAVKRMAMPMRWQRIMRLRTATWL